MAAVLTNLNSLFVLELFFLSDASYFLDMVTEKCM